MNLARFIFIADDTTPVASAEPDLQMAVYDFATQSAERMTELPRSAVYALIGHIEATQIGSGTTDLAFTPTNNPKDEKETQA
jgi:hypothetical protein